MKAVPITLRQANEYIQAHHRHHGRVQGCKFAVGVVDETGMLRGVAVTGRPVSRHLDNGLTAEVTRLCTDGYLNACSFLYGMCARIAKNMGYEKIITYTLASESGVSLRAAGWICAGERGGGVWSCPSRPRNTPDTGPKLLYYRNLR